MIQPYIDIYGMWQYAYISPFKIIAVLNVHNLQSFYIYIYVGTKPYSAANMPDMECIQSHGVTPGRCTDTEDTSLAAGTIQDSGHVSSLHCQTRKRRHRTARCCVSAKQETASVSVDSCHSSKHSSSVEAEAAAQWSIQCTLHHRDCLQQVHCVDPSRRWQAENSKPASVRAHLCLAHSGYLQLL